MRIPQLTIRRIMIATALVAVFITWLRPDRMRTYRHQSPRDFYWIADIFPAFWPRRIHVIRQKDLTRPSGMIYGFYVETN